MLNEAITSTAATMTQLLEKHQADLSLVETGCVSHVGHGIALADGLPGVQALELVEFAGGKFGMAFNLDPNQVGVVLLDASEGIAAGSRVPRSPLLQKQ